MAGKTALVVGATGVSGRGLIQYLDEQPDWQTIGLSRRRPDYQSRARFLQLDLLAPDDCAAKLAALTEVTHVFYCAFNGTGSWAEQIAPNLAILKNAVGAIAAASPGLEHVNLIQGTKVYGSHLGPFKTPAQESDPRHMPPNFYFDQEDWLRARSAEAGWSWSAVRPQTICGFAVGNPMNLTTVIAVYAAICRELGLPMRFPGKPGNYRALYQVTDARHLARSMVWMATEPACAGEAFNIVNGDWFRWEHMWPRLAAFFGLDPGTPQEIPLVEFMADKGPVWDRIVEKHGLAPHPYEDIALWPFADYVFGSEYDIMSSMTKARRYGFHDVVDSEEMFTRLFGEFQRERIIPMG